MESEFWCGLDWFDAQANCAQRCPTGSDDLCLYGLKCISGVATCKNELGYSNYPGLVPTANPTTSKPSRSPTPAPVGEDGVTSPAAPDDNGATAEPTIPLVGPYHEDMVRIILYGVNTLDDPALKRWRIMTEQFIESFFNEAKEEEVDQIRKEVFDVSVSIENPVQDVAPSHEFNPMVVGDEIVVGSERGSRNLRRNLQQAKNGTMITYSQDFVYRSNLTVLNDDPRLIAQRPLETAEYRAEYVSFLRSADFATFADLEFASKFLYSEFPTPAPTTKEPTRSPVVPGTPTSPPQTDAPVIMPTEGKQTLYPTSDLNCNLCLPGQYGLNEEVIWNGNVTTCVYLYNYFLEKYNEGSSGCRGGVEQLRSVCCRDGEPVVSPTPEPTRPPVVSPTPEPTRPVTPESSQAPTKKLEIKVDENGLPDTESLAATYYCGVNWNAVDSDCASATACPSGQKSDCPTGQECIAFTNCGGAWEFVSDPNIDGGGPDPDEVKSTFFCGSSMQFLEMNCEGATPCPNGPKDCDVESEGCFAFTGCNKAVDPGKFVGFLERPDESSEKPALAVNSKNYFCAETWEALDSSCVDGKPIGATPCPSGNILECPEGNGCFAYACNNGVPVAAPSQGGSPTFTDYSVEDVNLVKSTFFCGASVEEIDGDCENAIPCPSGDECPDGYGCFAFSKCGDVDIDYLLSTFGRTDRPTRAPTPPVEQVCDQDRKMSVNVGYWQSWSIYRDEDCQRMNTASFDASPYTHVVYSFASIDSSFRLEAWNGTFDNEVPLYKEFNSVKQRYPGIKTMIAVGGWTHNDPGPMQKRFSEMAGSRTNRQTFVQSVVQFLRTYGFDGLDLDWEYPGLNDRGGKRADYDNYVLMTKEIREAFNSAPESFQLTMAVPGNITKLEMGFDLAGLAKHVDWFNIMAYDLWGSWDPEQTAYSHTDMRMIDEAVDYMSHFIQKSKLVMGLGSYARTYTLAQDDCLDLGCPFEGPGKAGCQGTDGFLPYFEIADIVSKRSFDTIRFDDESQSMVMVTDGNRLISYDNTVSFNRKSDYAKDNCFQGVMLWAIDMLKDGSNPLSSNSGNSALTGDPSDQSFCGKDYQDVITGCKRPCTSGSSNQCPFGEICFANSGCSIDNIGAPPPTKCRLCPDPSTQGMKDWLTIEYNGEEMTCGDADMTVISEFPKGSEECDAAKQSLGGQCCYAYPELPCMLCRTETSLLDLRSSVELEYEGETMSCPELSKRMGPESSDGSVCLAVQTEYWDQCCYDQCTLCEGKGVKWWHQVEYDDKSMNCGELGSFLFSEEITASNNTCKEILTDFGDECCYTYPNDPCDICNSDGKKLTLMPAGEVEFDGSSFTCAEVNNFLSPFEASSKQCLEAKGKTMEGCCFDRCSLCGTGARLDSEVIIDVDGEDSTCAAVESSLFNEKVTDGAENCTSARSLYYDSCCFEIPSTPCQLCATDEYMHFATSVEFNDEEVTCRSVNNYLMERADTSSKTCSDARALLGETCCYATCNICGEFSLDWDVFIEYDGEEMSCGDLTEIFRSQAIVDGTEQCQAISDEYYSTCCYTSPTTSCQLCKRDGIYYDLNEKGQVDFNGPTTCGEVANFMSRRVEDTDQVCSVTQASLYDACCYEKCTLTATEGSYPDWQAEVEMNGMRATCFQLEGAIQDEAIAKDTQNCRDLQTAFSTTCSFTIPTNPCDLCPENDVSFAANAQWNGKMMTCSDISQSLKTREEADGGVCQDAQSQLRETCCFDQCHVCGANEETDPARTVYHNGKTTNCTGVDLYFYEHGIHTDSEECARSQGSFSECCYTPAEKPCNLCVRSVEGNETSYFDLMGTNVIEFNYKKTTCSELSDSMSRREEEGGDQCLAMKDEYFDACCDTKCSVCGDMGLDAGVQVSYEGRMMTCLELDLSLGPAAIKLDSEQCTAITGQYQSKCCYAKPEDPCRICPGDHLSVKPETSVNFLGTNTTCETLDNYLGSREEKSGETCQAISKEHYDECCYERCSLCGDGKADWSMFVTYEGSSIACGDFEWILKGKGIAADSDTCTAVKDEYFSTCCYESPETSCNLCNVNGTYLDVNGAVQVTFQDSPTTCLNLYNHLFVRESALGDQCQAAKESYAESCCFEKCNFCQNGFVDTTAKVNVEGKDVSCSSLELSFSQNVIAEGSGECSSMRDTYAQSCCYTIPENPCRLCTGGSAVSGDALVQYYDGSQKSCNDVANKLAITTDAGSGTCSSTQNDFKDACCYSSCPICPQGFNLNWEVDVEYKKATISCGEFDQVIRSNSIEKGTQECASLQSSYSSACCFNYATATAYTTATDSKVITVSITGQILTNLDTSSLTSTEKEQVESYFETALTSTFESNNLLPQGSTVTVTEIKEGVVSYGIDNPEVEKESVDTISAKINSVLESPATLDSISSEVVSQFSQTPLVEELSDLDVTSSNLSQDVVKVGDKEMITGKLDSNLDTSNLIWTQKEAIDTYFENAIQATLDSLGVAPAGTAVTVNDVGSDGSVPFEITVVSGNANAAGIAEEIKTIMKEPSTLDAIAAHVVNTFAGTSLVQQLSSLGVTGATPGKTTVSTTSSSTGANPCSLCKANEISLDIEILFNGVETSCSAVNTFLATQEAGSETCMAGTKALHDTCCLEKCEICSGGGIPDWYAMVKINGNAMTCLELDSMIADSQIEQGTEQCGEVLGVAAPACCYVPPEEPCNICKHNSGYLDVMSSVEVDYGGSNATCGQIFNALFSREEQNSETCSLVSQDLGSQCCYDKCSMCGNLQTDPALSVEHDGTKIGCSEFDSYIFSSNLIAEGSGECTAFQMEHRQVCCYDVSCELCSKGSKLYSTKETAPVTYGGTQTTCGEVANFLYQEKSQSNNCLAAKENIFSDCCFEQCELCGTGDTINWAATTMFAGKVQSCTDVYWSLVSESIEATHPTCKAASELSNDCCFKVPQRQCNLCKDENGVTYNTRWNKETTVNGITKTCGDFNTLLSTQEEDSTTCSVAKLAIFSDCCFAGSDELVALSNEASQTSDAACSLCQEEQVVIDVDVMFNGKPSTCNKVHTFLTQSFKDGSATCSSAQTSLSSACCLEKGENTTADLGSDFTATGFASPTGQAIQPPDSFEGWTVQNWNGCEAILSKTFFWKGFATAVSLGLLLFNFN